MANQQNSYTVSDGTGTGNRDFSYTFPSFLESEVKVEIDNVVKTLTTHYTIVNHNTTSGGTVRFNTTGLPDGTAGTTPVRIFRQTDVETSKAEFQAGSSLKAQEINDNFKQVRHALQEAIGAVATDRKIQRFNIEADSIDGTLIADNAVDTEHIANGAVDTNQLKADSVNAAKIADDVVNSEHIAAGAIDLEHMSANSVDSDQYVDGSIDLIHMSANSVDSDQYVDGSIDQVHLSNSAIGSNQIANDAVGTTEILNGSVTRAKLEADIIDGTKLADDAVDTEHIANGAVDTAQLKANSVNADKIADDVINSEHYAAGSIDHEHLANDIIDGDNIQNDVINSEHIAAGALDNEHYADGSITSNKMTGATVITASEQASATTNDTSFLTSAAADARFFNISSGDTIKNGQTFPDNDTTIATTAAINDRIIDIVNDVGGFDIVQSEQHFPNTNPQGQAGSAAVLSIKAASADLPHPSDTNISELNGTTLTIKNGNVANNADITITGVTATIPSGFGFIVESTGTTHEYTFHRLVPNATQVTTVAGKATEIGRLGTAAAVEDMSILGTADVVADLNTLGTADVVSDMNALAVTDVINDMNTLAVTDVISDMDTVATNVTNVNNVGNNITNVNSVSTSAGGNQTFAVTVQDVSGNKYFIDTVQTPVLRLARGKTYTFDMSHSSNSGHPLAFRDSSDNAYATGVTTSGTAGSSGATVVIVVAANAPSSLKYYCTSHGNAMGNAITVIDDNVGVVAGSITNVNNTGSSISSVNTVATSISNVNTVATNINNVNDFFDKYRVGANNPTSSLDTGDLFFNTTSDSLKVYTGSAWVDGVTATGNFAVVTGNTFTGSNNHNDNVKSIYGTGSDLEIYHSGTHSFIEHSGTGNLFIESDVLSLRSTGHEQYLYGQANNTCQLYFDNSAKLATTANGVTIFGTQSTINGNLDVGAGLDVTGNVTSTGNYTITNAAPTITFADSDADDYLLQANGGGFIIYDATDNITRFQINNDGHIDLKSHVDCEAGLDVTGAITSTGNITISSTSPQLTFTDTNHDPDFVINADGGYFHFRDQNAGVNRLSIYPAGSVNIPGNLDVGAGVDVTGVITATSHLDLPDNAVIKLGDSDDLQIYHSGSQSFIKDGGTGNLQMWTNQLSLLDSGGTESMIQAIENGAVELYHNNLLRFQTTTDGCQLQSNTTDAVFSLRSTAQDGAPVLQFLSDDYDDASDAWRLRADGGGTAFGIQNKASGSWENSIIAKENGNVELYHDNTKMLETTSTGISTAGAITAVGGTFNGDVQLTGDNYNVYWDKSENTLEFKDDAILAFGDNDDFTIKHVSSDSTTRLIEVSGGSMFVQAGNFCVMNPAGNEFMINAAPDGSVSLYHNNTKTFETSSAGATVTGVLTTTSNLRVSGEIDLGTANGNKFMDVCLGDNYGFYLRSTSGEGANHENLMVLNRNQGITLNYDANAKFATTADGIDVAGRVVCHKMDIDYESATDTNYITALQNDNGIKHLFRGDALYIGSNMTSSNQGSGPNGHNIKLATNGNITASAYYGDGSNLTGISSVGGSTGVDFNDNVKARFGTGTDLEIYHGGTHSHIVHTGSGTQELIIAGNIISLNSQNQQEYMLKGVENGQIELYHNNNKKFETTSDGVEVHGRIVIDELPAFHASQGNNHTSANNYVVYTNVVQQGSHYSTSTGKFTAPYHGVYHFYYGNIKQNHSGVTRSWLRKNGGNLGPELRMAAGGDYGDNGVQAMSVVLDANDYIQVYVTDNAIHANHYTTFGGHYLG